MEKLNVDVEKLRKCCGETPAITVHGDTTIIECSVCHHSMAHIVFLNEYYSEWDEFAARSTIEHALKNKGVAQIIADLILAMGLDK